MKRINNRGFSKSEFIIILCAIAILIAIGTKIAFDSSKSYGSFKRIANKFANAVAQYKDKTAIQKDDYSLYEIEESGYIEILANPVFEDEICDKYESYVSVKDNSKKKVTLVCGENLVEGIQGESYKIYEISEWSETRQRDYNDGELLYNYKENGKEVLSSYVPRKSFIALFEEKTGKKISDLQSVKTYGKELVNKEAYREKKLIKEIK